MIKLKLFPKIFLYTLTLLLSISIVSCSVIYLVAPTIVTNETISAGTAFRFGGMNIPRDESTTQAILASLPYTISISIIISLVCAFIFSAAITRPIKHILSTTARMETLDPHALCNISSSDEIASLAKNINKMYKNLLTTIEHLNEEKEKIKEIEKSKIDFLRSASHELKTPITALNAMLENMILKVGSYQDYSTFLPLCKEQALQLGNMITEILDASKLDSGVTSEPFKKFNLSPLLIELCDKYQMIARANEQIFEFDIPSCISVYLPQNLFLKAFSNILINAISYTSPQKRIFIYIEDDTLIVENECDPIPDIHLQHIFEPFYRPDYARDRITGGNGLGLYIVSSILNGIGLAYSFCPMNTPTGMRFAIKLHTP